MRCKPGDLCVIVWSRHMENIGRFVTIIGRGHPSTDMDWLCRTEGGRLTGLSSLTGAAMLGQEVSFLDSQLRPIRPHGGHDESFTWAGRPQETYLEALKSVLRERELSRVRD